MFFAWFPVGRLRQRWFSSRFAVLGAVASCWKPSSREFTFQLVVVTSRKGTRERKTTLVLEVWILTFRDNLVENVCCGSVDSHFFAKVSWIFFKNTPLSLPSHTHTRDKCFRATSRPVKLQSPGSGGESIYIYIYCYETPESPRLLLHFNAWGMHWSTKATSCGSRWTISKSCAKRWRGICLCCPAMLALQHWWMEPMCMPLLGLDKAPSMFE